MHGTDVGSLVALPKLLSHPSHLSPYSLLRAIFVTQCGDLCDGFGGLRFENTGSGSRRIYARRYAPVDVAMIGVGGVCVELSDVQVFILAEIQRRYILSFSAFICTYGMECPIDIFGALDGSGRAVDSRPHPQQFRLFFERYAGGVQSEGVSASPPRRF